jgi:hypothetical protein
MLVKATYYKNSLENMITQITPDTKRSWFMRMGGWWKRISSISFGGGIEPSGSAIRDLVSLVRWVLGEQCVRIGGGSD